MNVLVIGDSCEDIFIYGDIIRLSPEAPVPILQPIKETKNGGMALNVYNNFLSLGVEANIVTNKKSQIRKVRYVDNRSKQMVLRIDENDDCEEIDEITRMHICNNQYQGKTYDAIVISDYCKGFLSKTDIELLCKSNKNVFVDTKKQLGKWIEYATFVKINSFEYKKNYD
jgi:D-beta-D-heptose 7-phosphate kinase/D-beta-D-heptose 1-phosphate adenosyltransferase